MFRLFDSPFKTLIGIYSSVIRFDEKTCNNSLMKRLVLILIYTNSLSICAISVQFETTYFCSWQLSHGTQSKWSKILPVWKCAWMISWQHLSSQLLITANFHSTIIRIWSKAASFVSNLISSWPFIRHINYIVASFITLRMISDDKILCLLWGNLEVPRSAFRLFSSCSIERVCGWGFSSKWRCHLTAFNYI